MSVTVCSLELTLPFILAVLRVRLSQQLFYLCNEFNRQEKYPFQYVSFWSLTTTVQEKTVCC